MSWELISETEPKARKEHQCIWCGKPIEKGERYIRIVGNYEGDLQNQAWHMECNDAGRRYFSENDECEFTEADHARGSTRERWETVAK